MSDMTAFCSKLTETPTISKFFYQTYSKRIFFSSYETPPNRQLLLFLPRSLASFPQTINPSNDFIKSASHHGGKKADNVLRHVTFSSRAL